MLSGIGDSRTPCGDLWVISKTTGNFNIGHGPREGTMVGTGTIDLECPADNGQWTRSSLGQCNNPLVASLVLGQYPGCGWFGNKRSANVEFF